MPEFLFLVLSLLSRLKPLAGKRLKRRDKHVNLLRPSPSAAASVPLCISGCSFSSILRQNGVQTFSLLTIGAGRYMPSVHMGLHVQAGQRALSAMKAS